MRRRLTEFKLLVVRVAAAHDAVGSLTEEQITEVRHSFAEVPDAYTIEAWDHVRRLMVDALHANEIQLARAYLTIHKAVTR